MIISKEYDKPFIAHKAEVIYTKLKKRIGFNDQFCINVLGNVWVQTLVYEVVYQRLDFENLVYNVEKEIKKHGIEPSTFNKNLLSWEEILQGDLM